VPRSLNGGKDSLQQMMKINSKQIKELNIRATARIFGKKI
jgi:hypothetical protein